MTTRGSTVIPCIQYRDAPAMIDWLCDVIGFEIKEIHRDGDAIAHAELTLGNGMLMVSSVAPDETPYSRLTKLPEEVNGIETQSPSLTVVDPDVIYARVKERGGEIVMDIEDKPYGGRGFGCRDPEGHLWFIGSYNPWA